LGYTGAAVSHWERGHATINQNDREVLIAIVLTLYQCGGLQTLVEANELLALGNYRLLDEKEINRINPQWAAVSTPAQPIGT